MLFTTLPTNDGNGLSGSSLRLWNGNRIPTLAPGVRSRQFIFDIVSVIAVWAMRSGKYNAWRALAFLAIDAQQFLALTLPVMLQQYRYAQNHDIQKTTDQQA